MDSALSLLMQYGPLLIQFGPAISRMWDAATSNSTFMNIVEKELPIVADFANRFAAAFFPAAVPQVNKVVATALAFNRDLVMFAQRACNAALKLEEPLEVDGWYGPKTQAAVTELQKQLNLTADGWFGKITDAAVKQLKLPGLA